MEVPTNHPVVMDDVFRFTKPMVTWWFWGSPMTSSPRGPRQFQTASLQLAADLGGGSGSGLNTPPAMAMLLGKMMENDDSY